jgi:hypothetical protein
MGVIENWKRRQEYISEQRDTAQELVDEALLYKCEYQTSVLYVTSNNCHLLCATADTVYMIFKLSMTLLHCACPPTVRRKRRNDCLNADHRGDFLKESLPHDIAQQWILHKDIAKGLLGQCKPALFKG